MQINSPGRLKILNLAAILTVLGSAVSAVLQIDSILLRWQVILLLIVFVGLQSSLPEINESLTDRRKSSLIIALQTLIVVYLVLRTGIGFSFNILIFILSVNVALYNSLRWVFLWIAGFTLVTAFLNVRGGGWERLLLETAVYAAGYLFFGVTTSALRTAQLAQLQNERLYQKQTYLVAQQKELLEQQTALLDELKLKNKQLQEYAHQVETLAVVEERNRLSREMHDTLGHRLTSSAVQLEAAQRLLPEQSERAAIMIGEVRQEVRLALAELRQTVGRLREPVETELDLPQALQRIVERFQSASGLQVQLVLPQEICSMPPAQRLAMYRAAQEGLTNIQRHALATEACLRLICTPEEICLELQDNGQGLPVDGLTSTSHKGFGLRGLTERAVALGGEACLENAPGGGAILSVRLPRSIE
jgi:signal transduction histidine kinase